MKLIKIHPVFHMYALRKTYIACCIIFLCCIVSCDARKNHTVEWRFLYTHKNTILKKYHPVPIEFGQNLSEFIVFDTFYDSEKDKRIYIVFSEKVDGQWIYNTPKFEMDDSIRAKAQGE